MDNLLTEVLKVHGGPDRWSKIGRIEAEVTYGGPFWKLRGQPGLLTSQTIEADARTQHLAMTPLGGDFERSCVLEVSDGVQHMSIREGESQILEARDDPRQSFAGYDVSSEWDVLQTAYFACYATWTYLTEPFLLAYPGVTAREIEPWHERGQVWRRLAVTFPPTLATHSATQTYYYDADGLQRRVDYDPVVTGNSRAAEYTDEHDVFDGFTVPTRRRMYRRMADGSVDMGTALVTLDVTDLTFR